MATPAPACFHPRLRRMHARTGSLGRGRAGSAGCRACAVLSTLLCNHPVDRQGRCRSCRRPGAVPGGSAWTPAAPALNPIQTPAVPPPSPWGCRGMGCLDPAHGGAGDERPTRRAVAVTVTCARDGREHVVADEAMTPGNAGRYLALCGWPVWTAALVCPPGPRCSACVAVRAADLGSARRRRRRGFGVWAWLRPVRRRQRRAAGSAPFPDVRLPVREPESPRPMQGAGAATSGASEPATVSGGMQHALGSNCGRDGRTQNTRPKNWSRAVIFRRKHYVSVRKAHLFLSLSGWLISEKSTVQPCLTSQEGAPMPVPVPRSAHHRRCDVDGTQIALFCWVEQVREHPEPGMLLSRLHQQGHVLGRGTTRLTVQFDGERKLVSIRPQVVRVLTTPGGG